MITKRETEIDGVKYEFIPLKATLAREKLAILTNTFGPSWADAVEGLKGVNAQAGAEVLDLDTDAVTVKDLGGLVGMLSGVVAGFIRGTTKEINPTMYKSLSTAFLDQCAVDNGQGGMMQLTLAAREEYFATSLLTEVKVLKWCLSEQYADFFGFLGRWTALVKNAAKSAMEQAKKKENPSASSSPEVSTGGSTESPPQNDIVLR